MGSQSRPTDYYTQSLKPTGFKEFLCFAESVVQLDHHLELADHGFLPCNADPVTFMLVVVGQVCLFSRQFYSMFIAMKMSELNQNVFHIVFCRVLISPVLVLGELPWGHAKGGEVDGLLI